MLASDILLKIAKPGLKLQLNHESIPFKIEGDAVVLQTLNNRRPYQLHGGRSFLLFTVFLLEASFSFAQVNPVYDLPKPKAFENRKLASELTPDKPINPVKRVKQNVVTHYNFHFNAQNKLDKVIRSAKAAHVDTFTRLLTVFNYSLDKTAQQQQELDSVILKANNGILLHDLRNDWVDDLYLLMGKSYFFQKKYDSAYDVFQFINYNFQPREKQESGMEKSIGSNLNNSGNVYTISSREKKLSLHQSTRNESLLWIVKTLLEQGLDDEARSMMETLGRDVNFPKRLRDELTEIKGDWFYRKKQYDSAAYYLEKSLPVCEGNTEKSRRYYLIAQLHALSNQPEKADTAFEKAVSITTNPVLDAYARISQIGLSTTGKDRDQRITENLAALIKMGEKEKYQTFRGIIHAAAATLERSRNNTTAAIRLLVSSNQAAGNDAELKNTNSLAIAEMAFESRDYPLAKMYFDSANTVGHPQEQKLNAQKTAVTDLVKYLDLVKTEDSLQRIAGLPEKERADYLTALLKKMEKEKDAFGNPSVKKSGGQAIQRNRFAEDQTGSLFPSGATKGEWYFNNPTLKAQGSQAFQVKWGTRPNEDNWRRSSTGAATGRNATGRTRAITETVEQDEEERSIESLAAGLPLSAKSVQESNNRKADAARQLALIYKNKLGDCKLSVQWHEIMLNANSKHPELEMVLFDLAVCCKDLGLTEKMNRYRSQLEQASPGGNFTLMLNNPAAAAQKKQETNTAAAESYEKIYDEFLSGNFGQAIALKKTADSLYGKQAWTPQLMYIEAVYYVKSRQDSTAISILQSISTLFPSSPLARKATALADVVSRRSIIEKELQSMDVVRKKEDSISWVDDSPLPKTREKLETQEKKTEKAVAVQQVTVKPAAKDTTIFKAPPPSISQPREDTAYRFNANGPHAVIMLMNNVDVVYVNEAKRALNRYHAERFAENELTVNNDKIGNNPFIIISFFPNAAEAMGYWEKTAPLASREIFPWLPADKYKFYILSPDHLKKMMEEQKPDNFINFIKGQFPGKF
jgi:tetratricopeptide (TPR) repeat protein